MSDALARKLLVRPGARLAVVNAGAGYPLPEGVETVEEEADVLLLFAENLAQLDATIEETRRLNPGGVLWVAYPKGGAKAGTDLNRDILWRHLGERGLTGVTLVALDGRWSAMRFKRAT